MASSKTSSPNWPEHGLEPKPHPDAAIAPEQESITSARAYVDYILKARGIALPSVPACCVIVHSGRIIDQLRRGHPHHSIDIGSRLPSPIHFFTPAQGQPFAMVASHHGAPMAALLLEELIALGFQHFITVGPAGYPANGHAPALGLGDIILVDEALIYEGTSPHYGVAGASVAADPAMATRLADALARQGVACRRGRIATTDAIYRETPAFLDAIIARQALAIDMELSALFSVCRYHARPIGALLFISDIVGRHAGWDVAFMDSHVDQAERILTPVLLDCINAQ